MLSAAKIFLFFQAPFQNHWVAANRCHYAIGVGRHAVPPANQAGFVNQRAKLQIRVDTTSNNFTANSVTKWSL